MLETIDATTVQETVLRIFSIPSDKLILERGAESEDLDEIKHLLDRLGNPVSLDKIIDRIFQPKQDELMPFPVTRFSDGTFGVFSSALDVSTCEREVEYHLAVKFAENESGTDSYTRLYQLIECNYFRNAADLRGRESVHSDLVSLDETGYPFCQKLGVNAKELGIEGFLTPSAREIGGTCVPVFHRPARSKPGLVGEFELNFTGKCLEFKDS